MDNFLKKKFANDKSNHVSPYKRVYSSKRSSVPKEFFKKSKDGKGLEYYIKSFCSYLEIYYNIKKVQPIFDNNHSELFDKCELKFKSNSKLYYKISIFYLVIYTIL